MTTQIEDLIIGRWQSWILVTAPRPLDEEQIEFMLHDGSKYKGTYNAGPESFETDYREYSSNEVAGWRGLG